MKTSMPLTEISPGFNSLKIGEFSAIVFKISPISALN